MTTSIPSSAAGGADVAGYRQRHGILFLIFAVWVLSLPFYRFSVVSTFSVDNLLAPLLFLSAILLPRLRDSRIVAQRLPVLLGMFGLYALYGIAQLIGSIGVPERFWSLSWAVIRIGFYFMVPALFIRDLWSFRMMKSLLIIVTVVGGVSSLLVSLGVIVLDVQRFAETRVGLAWLPKSIGLFSSYGDLAMLYAFTAVVLISHGPKDLPLGIGTRLGKWLVWIGLLLGMAGSQSRNMLFVALIGVGAYGVHRKLQTSASGTRFAVVALVLAGTLVSVGIATVFGDVLLEEVSSMGGKMAHQTVDDRLMSYAEAWKLLVNEPYFGVSAETYRLWGPLIDHLHNMWMRLMLNGGILAVISVAGLMWMGYKAGTRPARAPVHPAEPSLVVATVVAIFIACEFFGGLSDIMWVLLGTLISFTWVRCQRT